jgi:hypothetical protein
MAKNIKMGGINSPVIVVDLRVTTPASNVTPGSLAPLSGTPVLCNRIPGVAEGDIEPTTGLTPVNISCVAELSVVGTNQSGNILVAVGDALYIDSSSGVISKDTTKVAFGWAFGNALDVSNALGTDTRTGTIIASGATATIRVWVGKKD